MCLDPVRGCMAVSGGGKAESAFDRAGRASVGITIMCQGIQSGRIAQGCRRPDVFDRNIRAGVHFTVHGHDPAHDLRGPEGLARVEALR